MQNLSLELSEEVPTKEGTLRRARALDRGLGSNASTVSECFPPRYG